MLMRMVYDDKLAQAAYLFGCQRSREAIVIDPERDVDRYIALAQREGLRITAVAETHIHADFLSGTRELAEATGARAYLSDEGGADWQYQWIDKKTGGGAYPHRLLKDGDTFAIGGVEFRAVHTPGHTPEHMVFLVTDRGGGANEPMGVVAGDFVFVGDVGRPDLLESAAGQAGASEPAARRLFASLRRFVELPDYLQVWPAHGAGSACGKALGAVPQTTIGYEKRFNPAFRAASSERGFVDFVLAGQPEPPLYFARMKRDNRAGPRVLGALPEPRRARAGDFASLTGATVVDTRPWAAFRAGHIPGSLFAPLDSSFHGVVGSYLAEDERIVLVVETARVGDAVRDLVRIGLDNVVASIDPSDVGAHGRLDTMPEIDVRTAQERARSPGAFLLDVRRRAEFDEGHIPGAHNVAHTRLPAHLNEIPRDRDILVNCRSGGRSGRACAYLRKRGYKATNLDGGFLAWEEAGGKVER